MPEPVIDNLQYANWSEKIFEQMREGGVDAVHVTVAYHETLPELIGNLAAWNRRFARWPDRLARATSAADVRAAQASGRTAILFGLQTPAPVGDDLGRIEILHQLGIRFMQLSYNNQSLMAAGCYESEDSGLTRFGREAVTEMNRVGLVIDMSHSAERSTRAAIDASARPIAITHANPSWWHDVPRNKSDEVLRALVARGGMLGFSLYPHHLSDGSDCTLDSFCAMVAEAAARYGIEHLGIGSDLCQDQPDSVVTWMRNGRWTASGAGATFPPQPAWFRDNRDFATLRDGFSHTGFSEDEIAGLLGGNWLRFYAESFEPQ